MADFTSGVAGIANPNVPNTMTTLGGVANIANSMQQLQIGRETLQQQRTVTQQTTMDLQERNALRRLDVNSYLSADGNFDAVRMLEDATKAAPKLGAEYVRLIAGAHVEGTHAKSAVLGLNEERRTAVAKFTAAMGDIPQEQAAPQWRALVDANPQLSSMASIAERQLNAAKSPQERRQLAQRLGQSVLSAETQAGVKTGTRVQTGTGALVQASPVAEILNQPNAPPAGAAPSAASSTIPPGIPPSGVEQPGADALGRPVIVKRDQRGAVSFAPPPGSSYKPLMTLPAGETPQTAAPLLALRDQAQTAAAAVPAQRFNNRQILSLSDAAFTGTGSTELAAALNAVGVPVPKKPEDMAAATTQLQHFIGLQIQQNAAAQGANTDAARQLAAQAVLPSSSPAQAIKAITKINDAYATGTEAFNRGMQAAVNSPQNQKDIFAIRDFQNAWTANMDPRIFLLENAVKAGDQAEVKRIKDSLGKAGTQSLLTKAQNLKSLIQRGQPGGP